jgi:hypothetical protein
MQIDFAERSLLNDQLAMFLPTNFHSIPPEQVYKPKGATGSAFG